MEYGSAIPYVEGRARARPVQITICMVSEPGDIACTVDLKPPACMQVCMSMKGLGQSVSV